MTDTADVVVVGGGVHGTSIAWNLARRGAGQVVLLEKTGIAAGATQYSSANVRLHYQMETLARMALFGQNMFKNFNEEVGGDCGWNQVGYVVFLPERDVKPARKVIAMQQKIGIDSRMITNDEILDIEPSINLDGIVAGCFEPTSGHADGALTARSFADAAEREGVDLLIGSEVLGVSKQGDGIEVNTDRGIISAGNVVLATGFRTSALLEQVGVEMPINPVRHTIAIVERAPGMDNDHPILSDRVSMGYYRQSGPGLTLIGVHDPLEGYTDAEVEVERPPKQDIEVDLASRFAERFPDQTNARLRQGYTGVYDCTPDFQPAFGAVPGTPGLFVDAGYSGHGFKLSPASGHLMADLILDGETSFVDMTPFRVGRFAENDLISAGEGYESRTLA
ncbi:MAG: FAD-binding oxidoreductase [Chloroflexi bacterium]|nr:FAD-binding oxidoreductase [Chloroflexota bacterium]